MTGIAFTLALLATQPVLDSDVPDYRPGAAVKGALVIGPEAGFEKLLSLWAQRLKTFHPDVRGPEFGRAWNQTTPQAMIDGNVRCGLAWKPWTPREIENFRDSTGTLPVEFVIGADAVVIVVHPDNPIRGLKLDELDAIYSTTLNRGAPAMHTWGEFKLGPGWKGRPLHPVALAPDASPASPTRPVFVERVLQKGKFREDVKSVASAAEVLRIVSEDPEAVGFVPFSAGTKGVRAIPILAPEGAPLELTGENILNETYPLAWRIRISFRNDRGSAPDPVLHEFLAFILSRDGQTIAAEAGYVPISGPLARKQTKLLK
jgi:phosphate transport system substrate-binding protein